MHNQLFLTSSLLIYFNRLILLGQNIWIIHSLWFMLNSKFDILLPKMVFVLHSQQYWLIFESRRVCFSCLFDFCPHSFNWVDCYLSVLLSFSMHSNPLRACWVLSELLAETGTYEVWFLIMLNQSRSFTQAVMGFTQHDTKCAERRSKRLEPPGFWLEIYNSTLLGSAQ